VRIAPEGVPVSRLEPIVEASQVPPEGRADFEAVIASRGRINAPQSIIMYSPALSSRATALNDALRSALDPHDYELAVLVAAREFPIDFVWHAHVPTALRVGVSEELVEAIRTGGAVSDATDRERVIVNLGRELIGQRNVTQGTFDSAREELGEKLLVEVLMTMGNYLMIGCVLIAAEVEPSGAAPPLPNLPR
jgi:4-carboxymuconolactone decarboxylase